MDKPVAKPKSTLDWHECVKYIEHKYNITVRDFADRHTAKGKQRYEEILKGLCEKYDIPYKDINKPKPEESERRIALFKEYESVMPPYQDFWHWIVDNRDIRNGSYFTLSNEDFEDIEEDWQKTILEYVLAEFGKGDNREVEFYAWW